MKVRLKQRVRVRLKVRLRATVRVGLKVKGRENEHRRNKILNSIIL